MIYIAICDDNIADTESIEEYINNLQSRFVEVFKIDIFYSGQSFCKAIEKRCPFDIVLMDIEMDNINGITAGHKLRSDDENDLVQLIYISSHEDYYRELFDVQPAGFIDKPINKTEFESKLLKIISKVIKNSKKGKRKVLPIYQHGREVLVPLKKIMYLESHVRIINLVTTEGVIKYYSTLKTEEVKLINHKFVRTHQSFIVNLHYIKIIDNSSLTLVNNVAIPISNKYKSLVKKNYMEYRRNYFA